MAQLTGIRVDRAKIIVFSLCGLLCGLAGMFQAARVYAATPTMGDGMEMDVIASVVWSGEPRFRVASAVFRAPSWVR